MQLTQHSRTAFGVAAYRAAHQIAEDGKIFCDPFARVILGDDADAAIGARSHPAQLPMRLFLAARSRFAEDNLAVAMGRGVRQVVILGAGLDTFALRNPNQDVIVFEVDLPATQEWKRECFSRAGLSLPPTLAFAPIDFEQQTLAEGLRAAGFDALRPAFFVWLGVVPYLSANAVAMTLDFVTSTPASEIVFDYFEPVENYPSEQRAVVEALAARVAAVGEPWLSYFDPLDIAQILFTKGFDEIEDLRPAVIAERFFRTPPGELTITLGAHVLRARRSTTGEQ